MIDFSDPRDAEVDKFLKAIQDRRRAERATYRHRHANRNRIYKCDDDNAKYMPTEEEIAVACAHIRQRWSPEEREKRLSSGSRMRGVILDPVHIPEARHTNNEY